MLLITVLSTAAAAIFTLARAINCAGGSRLRAEVDCRGTVFFETNFNRIDASSAIFDKSTFVDVAFGDRSYLESASFVQTEWTGNSKFTGTNLNSVSFLDSIVDEIDFLRGSSGTAVANSTFKNVVGDTFKFMSVLGSKASFDGARVDSVLFENSQFSDSSFRSAKLINLGVRGGSFERTTFAGAEMSLFAPQNVSFRRAVFQDAQIGEMVVDNVNFETASFEKVSFQSLKMLSSSFKEAVFVGCSLGNIEMNDSSAAMADFSRAVIRQGSFSGDLSEIKFTQSAISNITFMNANLARSNFAGAILQNVVFVDTILDSATLRGASLTNVAFANIAMGGIDLADIVQDNVTVTGVDENCCNACAVLNCECTEGCGTVTTGSTPQTTVPTRPTAGSETIGAKETADSGGTPVASSTETAVVSPSAMPSPMVEGQKNACFPASATVELQDGSSKLMKDLAIGDVVRVSEAQYSRVFFFSHRTRRGLHEFLRITAADGSKVVLSPGHYVYLNGHPMPARKAKPGDLLRTSRSGLARVVSAERIVADGLYNPHTLHGDIVADGVVTSTFTESVPPTLATALLIPERIMSRLGFSVYKSVLHGNMPAPLSAAKELLIPSRADF